MDACADGLAADRVPGYACAMTESLTPLSVDASVEAIQRLSIVPKVLEAVCKVTGMRFAAIARVTDDRWTACAVLDHLNFGLLPGGDLVLNSTICDEIRQHRQSVIFGHASHHPVFSAHHTPRIYGLESYVSVPILTEGGKFFGTLCAIDSAPRDFDEGTILASITMFAELVASHLALHDRTMVAETALKVETETGALREQFLAVVGHDLRSPLQGAKLAAELLEPLQEGERAKRLTRNLSQSLQRMTGLIADVMDLARGRLAGRLELDLEEGPDMQMVLAGVVEEVRLGNPACQIVTEGEIDCGVRFDERRIRQLMANLLNNALAHGDPAQPVVVTYRQSESGVEVSVTNAGDPIPADFLPRLFEPFFRPESPRSEPGLGLGLYIASEIARGHGGSLRVDSSANDGTRFTLSVPRARVAA